MQEIGVAVHRYTLTSLGYALPGARPWYTCLISVLLLMFYLSYQSYTLACTNGMALTALGQLARGKPLGPPSPHV